MENLKIEKILLKDSFQILIKQMPNYQRDFHCRGPSNLRRNASSFQLESIQEKSNLLLFSMEL